MRVLSTDGRGVSSARSARSEAALHGFCPGVGDGEGDGVGNGDDPPLPPPQLMANAIAEESAAAQTKRLIARARSAVRVGGGTRDAFGLLASGRWLSRRKKSRETLRNSRDRVYAGSGQQAAGSRLLAVATLPAARCQLPAVRSSSSRRGAGCAGS